MVSLMHLDLADLDDAAAAERGRLIVRVSRAMETGRAGRRHPRRAGRRDDPSPDDANVVLYARDDLIPGPDGEPLLLELELTEPSVFLSHPDGVADRLAAAIAARLG